MTAADDRKQTLLEEFQAILEDWINHAKSGDDIEKNIIKWCLDTDYALLDSLFTFEDRKSCIDATTKNLNSGFATNVAICFFTSKRIIDNIDGYWSCGIQDEILKTKNKINTFLGNNTNLTDELRTVNSKNIKHELSYFLKNIGQTPADSGNNLFSPKNLIKHGLISSYNELALHEFKVFMSSNATEQFLGMDDLHELASAAGRRSDSDIILPYILESYIDVSYKGNLLLKNMIIEKNEKSIGIILTKLKTNFKISIHKDEKPYSKGQKVSLHDYAMNRGLSENLIIKLKDIEDRESLCSLMISSNETQKPTPQTAL